MMLTFELGRSNGRVRFFATSEASRGLLEAFGRTCLDQRALSILERSGFVIRVNNGPVENVQWRP